MAARDNSGFNNMSPQEKADAFDASHSDPYGYAAKNFVEADPPTTPIRTVQQPQQGDSLPQRGRHRKG